MRAPVTCDGDGRPVAWNAGIVVETPDSESTIGESMLRRRAESGTFGMNCTGRPSRGPRTPI
jgi:hypothetical protein